MKLRGLQQWAVGKGSETLTHGGDSTENLAAPAEDSSQDYWRVSGSMQEHGSDMCGCARLRCVGRTGAYWPTHGWRQGSNRLAEAVESGVRQVQGEEGERFTGTEAASVTEARLFPAVGAVGVDSWGDVNLALYSHT